MYFPLPYLLTRSQPNTYSTFKNNILYVYAERDIRKGEMISVRMEGNVDNVVFICVLFAPFFLQSKVAIGLMCYVDYLVNDVCNWIWSSTLYVICLDCDQNELCCLMDMVCPNGHLQAISADLLRNHKLSRIIGIPQ